MTFHSRKSVWAVLCGLALCATTAATPARADSLNTLGVGTATGEAKFASGTGNLLFLAGSVVLPLLADGKDGKQHALRTADALLTSTLITTALKRIVREPRPGSPDDRTSFPSGQATAAFAAATMASHYHPKQALWWYGGATLIAASRVQLNRHRWDDVLGGGAIGYLTARLELKSKRGLILAPFIPAARADRHSASGGFGLQLSKSF